MHDEWQPIREAARHHRSALISEHEQVLDPDTLLERALDAAGFRARARPPSDPLLCGAHAVLDPEARTIWLRDDAPPPQRRLFLAHEIGHAVLHYGACACAGHDLDEDQALGEALVGYGPRERREAEANLFAREFLLPLALASDCTSNGLSATKLAARAGLPLSTVLSQLMDSLVAPPFPSGAIVSPAASSGLLDSSQQAAAHALGGPLLALAGPGTGKTRTLVARVLFLVREQSVAPETVLALTFGRKAAREVRERIAAQDQAIAARAAVSTFHAYGLDLLRRHPAAAGLPPRPVLLSPVDAFALLERHVDRLGLFALRYLHDPAFPLPEVLRHLARAKEDLVSPNDLAARADARGDDKLREAARIYAVYEQLLREHGALDLSDLITRAVQLLESNEFVLRAERARWRHVLVDEYQDINQAQGRLLGLLGAPGGGAGLWAVGDQRQAIYGFRGAAPANVDGFEAAFPGGRRVPLAVNYRSRPGLVALFGAVNGEGPAAWRAAREGEASVTLAVAADETAQADGIAAQMRRFAQSGYVLSDQVVLCRTRRQAAALRVDLSARGIFVVPGVDEDRFFAAADNKRLLALLSHACEPDGSADVAPRSSSGGDAWDFLTRVLWGASGLGRGLSEPAMVHSLLAHARAFRERTTALADESEDPRRAFLDHLRRLARLGGGGSASPSQVPEGDHVQVLTVHAAKGLEFPIVFVANLSAGKFPSRPAPSLLPRSNEDHTDDEEARLFFVAITRARDHLVLSRAQTYNRRRAAPSPLLACLDNAAGVGHEVWPSAPQLPPGPPSLPPKLGGPGGRVEAWEAELYARCPRRYQYERVYGLRPSTALSPYADFKRAVTHALAGPDTLDACWREHGPDPSHPHAAFYRQAAQQIVAGSAAALLSGRSTPDLIAVALDHGTVLVRPDAQIEENGTLIWERRTFRKPPPGDAAAATAPAETRVSLLQEAAERSRPSAPPVVRVRYLQTGVAFSAADKPKQRVKNLAVYDAALRGIALRVFPARPADPADCSACPYFFICEE